MTDFKPPFLPDLETAIARLRQLTEINVQTGWQSGFSDLSRATATLGNLGTGQAMALNAKGHLAWAAGRQVLWLGQQFLVPTDLHGYPLSGLSLRLALTWWADSAQIFVNGQLVQEGDLFDCSTRILLSSAVTPGEKITVTLRLVSPGHDDGALVRSLAIYESITNHPLHPGFIADELAVLQTYLATFAPDELEILAKAIAQINWVALPQEVSQFEQSLDTLHHTLLNLYSSRIKTCKIHLLGHAHLDMAWLWPLSETWEAAQRTFTSVLNLQQDFPSLTFCHSTPALYAWIEAHRPDLFAAIQQQVKIGRWEVVGGMWVEPELNLINGESIVRQILYGQRYVQAKFGQLSTVAWLPDTFGFCATLPQFLKQGGIEYFVTQKLRWNDSTQFPFNTFWWQAPDGTQIFSLMSPPIGEGIDPLKMATYHCNWEKQTGLKASLWLPGVGDHGGGPTRDMLTVAERWQQSPLFPDLEFTTAASYLQQINSESLNTPIWQDELYLEFHRGCYTTHADQKRCNRQAEGLLYEAELWAALTAIATQIPYPQTQIEVAWKQVLLNQFHDILPGTSIPEVFVDANQAWQEVEQVGKEILNQALSAIASQICIPSPPHPEALPLLIFNSLNWQRSEVVTVPLPNGHQSWQVYDLNGQPLLTQLSETTPHLLFLATDIPSVGYRLFWLCPQAEENLNLSLVDPSLKQRSAEKTQFIDHKGFFNDTSENKKSLEGNNFYLENEYLRIIVDAKTGDLSSVFDQVQQREILNQGIGNQLQAFQDSGQYWDAWNIDPQYAQHPLPPTQLQSIQWVDRGQVQQRLRVVRQLGKSVFYQDYILSVRSPVLKIVTTVDWQERQVLVKAAFPLNLKADFATYEIACGAIQRLTQPQTPEEKAKWEVPALRWADLSEDNQEKTELATASQEVGQAVYGVSLLNDCKYGYDAARSQLRLTLLRSPSWPDPEADRGMHEFTYALYPHQGTWQQAHTVRRGYELNLPLQVRLFSSVAVEGKTSLPPVSQLLDFSAENLILMAFKLAEDNPQQWILRCYECHGEAAQFRLHSDLGLAIAHPVDLLERSPETPQPVPKGESFTIEPWKITSFAVTHTEFQR
jgi:alpha-mannosidase